MDAYIVTNERVKRLVLRRSAMDECPSCGESKIAGIYYPHAVIYECRICDAVIEPAVEFRVEAHE
jgi:hypothetical protein